MTDVFMERNFEQPVTDEGFDTMLSDSAGCFGLYHVEWHRSCLSTDGRRMICWFNAPDTESMRQALRKGGLHATTFERFELGDRR